jgi:hypothetical protein
VRIFRYSGQGLFQVAAGLLCGYILYEMGAAVFRDPKIRQDFGTAVEFCTKNPTANPKAFEELPSAVIINGRKLSRGIASRLCREKTLEVSPN